jgi:hypothetical protein
MNEAQERYLGRGPILGPALDIATAIGSQQQPTQNTAPREVSRLEQVIKHRDNLTSSLQELAARAFGLAETWCGAIPQKADEVIKEITAGSLIDVLEQQNRRLGQIVGSLRNSLDRLQSL